jgi:RNA polymerase sigma factor (sigma-70 family)
VPHKPAVSLIGDSLPFDPVAARKHLIRLCRRWTSDANAAEDIAQEAIVIALRRLRSPETAPRDWAAYLPGIARRLCLAWNTKQQRERSRSSSLSDMPDETLPHYASEKLLPHEADTDPLEHLIRSEREELIDRALNRLKGPVRQMLVARYVEDLPMAVLAERFGITENAATVRVHRSREALRKVLETALRDEANAHGLLDSETAAGWRETPLYCCRCGTAKLLGRFEVGDFALRCPTCTGQLIGMTSHVAPMESATVLDGVQGFRAGLNRVNRWWQGYIADALQDRIAPCIRCGQAATVRLGPGGEDVGLAVFCDACRAPTFYIHPTGLLYHSDEAQAFWRRYPRMQNRWHEHLVCENRPAIRTTFADRLTSARLDMIFDIATLRPLHVETTGT